MADMQIHMRFGELEALLRPALVVSAQPVNLAHGVRSKRNELVIGLCRSNLGRQAKLQLDLTRYATCIWHALFDAIPCVMLSDHVCCFLAAGVVSFCFVQLALHATHVR